VVNEKSAFFCFPLPTPYPFGLPADYQPKRQEGAGNLFSFGRSEIPIPCMTAGSKQHKATTGVPDGRLF